MQELIPITLFICIAYAIHAIADARARSKLVAPHVPEEVIRSLAVLEEERRRQGALRWGISLVCLALAMALLEAIGARDYPVVQNGILLIACLVILVNFVVDVLYGLVNPRIRHQR